MAIKRHQGIENLKENQWQYNNMTTVVKYQETKRQQENKKGLTKKNRNTFIAEYTNL